MSAANSIGNLTRLHSSVLMLQAKEISNTEEFTFLQKTTDSFKLIESSHDQVDVRTNSTFFFKECYISSKEIISFKNIQQVQRVVLKLFEQCLDDRSIKEKKKKKKNQKTIRQALDKKNKNTSSNRSLQLLCG